MINLVFDVCLFMNDLCVIVIGLYNKWCLDLLNGVILFENIILICGGE